MALTFSSTCLAGAAAPPLEAAFWPGSSLAQARWGLSSQRRYGCSKTSLMMQNRWSSAAFVHVQC